MKRIYTLAFFTFIFNFCSAQAVVTGSVGVNLTYGTLSAAFNAINGAAAQTGANILITITADLAEPVTPVALTYKNWATLTIQPSGARTVSGTPTNQLIGFNGARFVSINGLNSGGNTLLINCTNTSPAITFYNAASGNTVKNLTVKANTSSITSGVVFFSNTTAGGDNNNVIDNCDITASTPGSAVNLVYSNGTAGTVNKNDTIRNSRLYDNFNATGSSNSILLDANNDSWVIENNHYYQTASRVVTSGAPVYSAINVNGCIGDNFKIDNNTIGGTSVTHTGYSTYGPNTQAASVKAIILNNAGPASAAYPSNSYVTNNTIRGIQVNSNKFSTVKGANTFVGIEVSNGATTDEAYITNNTIGGFSFTALIKIEATSTTANQVPCAGIYNRSSKGNIIEYNTIGSIAMYQTAVTLKTTTFDAIYSDPLVNSTTSISYNSIGGYVITTVYTGARVYGIEIANTTTTGTSYNIMHNTIRYLEHTGSSVAINYPLAAINAVGGGDQATIAYNEISNLTFTGSLSTTDIFLAGIRAFGQTGAGAQPNRIYKNKLYYLNTPSNFNSQAGVIGVSLLGGGTHYVYNNMIAVGENSTSSLVLGINQNSTNTTYFYNNSIYILGPGNGSDASACYRHYSNTNTTYAYNNIFQNDRMGGYGLFFQVPPVAATPYLGNNNIYNVPNGYTGYTGSSSVYDLPTFQSWFPAGTSEGSGSKEAEVTFASLPYLTTFDPDVINAGMNLSAASPLAITDDIDDEARTACFDIGADEVYFHAPATQLTWTGSVDTKWCTPCNWDRGISPDSLHTVFIDSGFARYPVIDAAHNCAVTGLPQADSVNIASGAVLTINSSALEIFGQLNNNGTITNPGGGMGFTSSIKNQEINSDTDLVLNNLYIRGASTKKYLNRNTTVNTFAHCASCSANLLLGTDTLAVNTSATGSLNSHIVTNGTGTVTVKNISAAAKLFPIGHDETHYNPVSIAAGDNKNYNARVEVGISPAGNSNPLLGVNRTWNITASAVPAPPVSVTFNYYDADVNVSCAPHSNMDLGHYYTSPISIWNVDQVGQPVTVAAFNSVTFNVWNWNSSNPLIIGNAGIVLATSNTIVLAANRQNNLCRLAWDIQNGNSSGYFDVQHSADGINFTGIAALNIVRGLLHYSFTDGNANAGKNFYRIKMQGPAGEIMYSNIVMLAGKDAAKEMISIYPSPVHSQANLLITAAEKQVAGFNIFDSQGKLVLTGSVNILAGENTVPLNLQNLRPGYYVIHVNMDGPGNKTVRFVKE